MRMFASLILVLVLGACSLPRGAAVQGEVVRQQRSENPSFQVVPVTRAITPQLAKWPLSGWHGHYHWLNADTGPDSAVIRTGDRLNVVVWDNQENSLISSGTKQTPIPTLTVSPTGQVFVPYVGQVLVRGLTEESARNRIQREMEMIVPSAQVQLAVIQGRNNSFDIVSGVGAPGRYPLENQNTRILSALSMGGGINQALRNPLVRLQRSGHVYETRMDSLLSRASQNVRVKGGDQIAVIEDNRSFNVLGASGRQDLIYFEKDRMSVMEAISSSGGLNSRRADPKGVLVLREYHPRDLKPGPYGPDMQQVIFSLDLTNADGLFAARQFLIQPNDTLLATESPITAAQTILGLFGTVVGVVSTVENLSD